MATVLVPLAQGCEELEAVTIIDLYVAPTSALWSRAWKKAQ